MCFEYFLQLVYEIPGDVSVTLVDANEHPIVGPVIEGRSELIALSLWLMAERSADSESAWHPFLKTLPVSASRCWRGEISSFQYPTT